MRRRGTGRRGRWWGSRGRPSRGRSPPRPPRRSCAEARRVVVAVDDAAVLEAAGSSRRADRPARRRGSRAARPRDRWPATCRSGCRGRPGSRSCAVGDGAVLEQLDPAAVGQAGDARRCRVPEPRRPPTAANRLADEGGHGVRAGRGRPVDAAALVATYLPFRRRSTDRAGRTRAGTSRAADRGVVCSIAPHAGMQGALCSAVRLSLERGGAAVGPPVGRHAAHHPAVHPAAALDVGVALPVAEGVAADEPLVAGRWTTRARSCSSSSPCRRCGRSSRSCTWCTWRCSRSGSDSRTAPRGVGRLPPAGGEASGRAGVDAVVDRAAEHRPAAAGGVARPADRAVGGARREGVRARVGGEGGRGHGGADEQAAARDRPEATREPVDQPTMPGWSASSISSSAVTAFLLGARVPGAGPVATSRTCRLRTSSTAALGTVAIRRA